MVAGKSPIVADTQLLPPSFRYWSNFVLQYVRHLLIYKPTKPGLYLPRPISGFVFFNQSILLLTSLVPSSSCDTAATCPRKNISIMCKPESSFRQAMDTTTEPPPHKQSNKEQGIPRRPLYMYYKGYKVNLAGFQHPGGDFLSVFEGQDITGWVMNAHYSDSTGKVEKILKARRVKDFFPAVSERTASFLQVFDKVAAINKSMLPSYLLQRLVDYQLLWMAGRLINLPLAWAVILALGMVRTVYNCHDFGHHAVFNHSGWDRFFYRLLPILILGFDGYPNCRRHFLHHAFPNIVELDSALHTAPFLFNQKQLQRFQSPPSPSFLRLQWLIWCVSLPFLAPMVLALEGFSPMPFTNPSTASLMTSWKRYLPFVLLLVARWALVLSWSQGKPLNLFLYVIIPLVVGVGIPSLVASLNHFHMPMESQHDVLEPSASPANDFIQRVVEPTQDMEVSFPSLLPSTLKTNPVFRPLALGMDL